MDASCADINSVSGSSVQRPPFAIEEDRSAPPPSNVSSGGKGRPSTTQEFAEGGYAGVRQNRINEIREVKTLPKKQHIDPKISVSDQMAAEDVRFFESQHKVGRLHQPDAPKFSTDPRIREQYRYYIAASGDTRVPGIKRHASCPRVGPRPASSACESDAQKPTSSCGHEVSRGGSPPPRPASSCGDVSKGSGARKSGTSVRSRSSVGRSSATSEQSYGGYSGSVLEPAAHRNPFQRKQRSDCSSQTSRTPTESTVSRSKELSARNLRNHDKVKFAPPARSHTSATTSASGWSKISSENSSDLYSQY